MNEKTIIGLLLRAHKESAAQSATAQYVERDAALGSYYDGATQCIENAIWQCVFAARCEGKQAAEKSHGKG